MTVNPTVIEELREMFRSGATPSRLVQHIAERHPEEERLHFLVQDYFREAFGVDIVRGVSLFDPANCPSLRYAWWNNDLLAEMVEKQAIWNCDANRAEGAFSPWFAGLTAKSLDEHFNAAKGSGIGELRNVWDRLDPQEQATLQRLIAGHGWNSEKVKILTHLAERLQQRVTELEGQLEKVSESTKG